MQHLHKKVVATIELEEDEEDLINKSAFELDIVLQLINLRELNKMSTQELSERTDLSEKKLRRMEETGCDKFNLAILQKIADVLDAYIDIVLVPKDQVDYYLRNRYIPLLATGDCA